MQIHTENMSLFNFLRGVFGLPPERGSSRNWDLPEEMPYEFRNPMWNFHDDDFGDETGPENNLTLFSDPFGMHKFFEREMDKILHNFGLSSRSLFEPPSLGNLPQFSDEKSASSKSLRDECLKPSFEMPGNGTRKTECLDNDIDDKATAEDVGKHFSSHLDSFKSDTSKFPFSFFPDYPSTGKTVNKPDEKVEIYRSSPGGRGNEEVTVRRGNGWTVITKRFSYSNVDPIKDEDY